MTIFFVILFVCCSHLAMYSQSVDSAAVPLSQKNALPLPPTTSITLRIGNDIATLPEFAIVEDSTRRLTIEDIIQQSNRFLPADKNRSLQFPPTDNARWICFKLRNYSGQTPCLLIDDTGIDTTQTFTVRLYDTSITRRTAGLTFSSSHIPGLPLRVVPLLDAAQNADTSQYIVYVRIVSRELLGLFCSIGSTQAIMSKTREQDLFNTFCIGVMVALVLYNLFLSVFLRSMLYAVYVCYGSTAVLYTLYTTGLIVPFVGERFTETFVQGQAVPIALLVLVYSLLFTIFFLEIRTKIRVFWIPSLAVLGAILSIIVFWFLGLQGFVYYALNFATMSVVIICVGAAIVSAWRGNRGALIYLAAWSILLLVFVFVGLLVGGFLPLEPIVFVLPQIGFSSELLLMSLALAYRIRILENERQSALLENERIMREQNTLLERTVRERTLELEDNNHQLSAANEEIQRQLEIQTEQARAIEMANAELQVVSDNLVVANQELIGSNKAQDMVNAQLAQKNQELATAEQFRLNMLSIVSHDLKSPISGVLGLSAVLLDDPSLSPRVREVLEHIHDAGYRMNRLVVELLDTAAREMGKIQLFMQPTELREILSEIVARYQTAAAHKQQTFIFPETGEYWTLGDVQRIGQVFDNIISNAVKYSPLGGTITITLSASRDMVRVAVKDEGVGFTDDDKSKLFGFFQRLSAQPTGNESSSGVGLAIVKQIVDVHQGRVWVESDYGSGSTFIVELPAENERTMERKPTGEKQ